MYYHKVNKDHVDTINSRGRARGVQRRGNP